MDCQTNNVKNLGELAQAIKEKINKKAEVEALRKLLDNCRALTEEKEKEVHNLRVQFLSPDDSDRVTLQNYQEKLEQAKVENHQLREKMQLQ